LRAFVVRLIGVN